MSNSSIYEKNWINLVFENRNQAYGAYQLRQETTKTTLKAFVTTVLFITVFFMILGQITHKTAEENIICNLPVVILQTTDIIFDQTVKDEPQIQPTIEQPTTLVNPMTEKPLSNPTVVSANQADAVKPNTTTTTTTTTTNSLNTNPTDGGTNATNCGNSVTAYVPSPAISEPSNSINTTAQLDKLPAFPNGIDQFYKQIANQFRVPDANQTGSVRMYVSFVVEKDGSMSQIKVVNTVAADLELEAIRVFKSIKTKWSPGFINNQAVRTAYTLPITIQVQ
jgi:hypothetical protein